MALKQSKVDLKELKTIRMGFAQQTTNLLPAEKAMYAMEAFVLG